MMNRWIDIRLWMATIVILLMAGCGSANDEPVEEGPVESSFMMYIIIPDNPVTTRSDGSDDRSIFADRPMETNLQSLRAWVFARNESGELIPLEEESAINGVLYYRRNNFDNVTGVHQVAFDVKDGFKAKYPYLDVYVLGNAESIGRTASWGSPRAKESGETDAQYLQALESELEELQLTATGAYFGVSPFSTTDNTESLPMTGYLKQTPVAVEKIIYSTKDITLMRAVSKIRFVFAKTGAMADATINGITLNADLLPETEWLFSGKGDKDDTLDENGIDLDLPLHDPGYSSTYYHNVIDFGAPAEIKTHITPALLKWDATSGMSRQAWENSLNDAISANNATEYGPFYFLESDKQLEGTISYTLPNGTGNSITFSMTSENNFLRNHSWTIYAYFANGGLVYEVTDWEEEVIDDLKPFI